MRSSSRPFALSSCISVALYSLLSLCVYLLICHCRELGTVPPKADLKQEAIVLMHSKRIEVLKQKLDSMEQESAHSLTAGTYHQSMCTDDH